MAHLERVGAKLIEELPRHPMQLDGLGRCWGHAAGVSMESRRRGSRVWGAVPLAPALRYFNYGPTPVEVGSCATSPLLGARMASDQKAAHLEGGNQGKNWFKDKSASQQ